MPNAKSPEPKARSSAPGCSDYLTRIKTSAPLYDLSEDDLWAHAAAAQLAVRAITQECPGAQLPAVTSTAALLDDIGKLVMSRCLNASVETIVSHARQAGITFVEAERQLFGVNHAAVGAAKVHEDLRVLRDLRVLVVLTSTRHTQMLRPCSEPSASPVSCFSS